MELALSEDLLKQFDKTTQTAYERFYGVVKKQPAQQQPAPQQSAVIPDSIRALLSDSAKAIVDSIKAVTDSIQAANQSLRTRRSWSLSIRAATCFTSVVCLEVRRWATCA